MSERQWEWGWESATCGLAVVVGRLERCPGTLCPFWQTSRAPSRPSGCALHRIAPQLGEQRELARHLLDLRARLDEVGRP